METRTEQFLARSVQCKRPSLLALSNDMLSTRRALYQRVPSESWSRVSIVGFGYHMTVIRRELYL
jgi:hypothetical protein